MKFNANTFWIILSVLLFLAVHNNVFERDVKPNLIIIELLINHERNLP